jgi:CubicO group peptidase (beta-lactamase class C family)
VADLPSAVDQDELDAAVEEAFNGGGEERVRAFLIVYGGAVVYERYSPNPDDGRDLIGPSYSVSKSVLSTFVGILVRDGLLDIHAPASVAEWHVDPDDPRAAITVEHMLHMATGIPWIEDPGQGSTPGDTGSNLGEMGNYPDRSAYAASLELVDAPGTVFNYSSGTSMVLARVFGDLVGSGRDGIRAFMDQELLDRIGMTSVATEFDQAGHWIGAHSADATARDFARLGLLYLRGGVWDGETIIPRSWVEYSWTPSPASAEYGAHWWLDPSRPGVASAIGAFGQFIVVDPAHDLVVVQLSELPWEGDRSLVDHVLDTFAEVVPES